MKIRTMIDWPVRFVREGVAAWRQWRQEGFRLRVTGRAVTIVTGREDKVDGGVYRIPRSRQFAVRQVGAVLEFRSAQHAAVDVPFADAAMATRALDRVGRRLMSNRVLVWCGRGLAFAVVWLLVSSYLTVRQQQQLAQQDAATAQQAVDPAPLPDPQGPMQVLPGVSTAPADRRATPSVVTPATPAAVTADDMGLGGFGLKMHPGAAMAPAGAGIGAGAGLLTSPMAAEPSFDAGPGCDPALAFEAPGA